MHRLAHAEACFVAGIAVAAHGMVAVHYDGHRSGSGTCGRDHGKPVILLEGDLVEEDLVSRHRTMVAGA